MKPEQLKQIIEASIFAAEEPLSIAQLQKLFAEGEEAVASSEIRQAIKSLQDDFQHHGVELVEVASGFRFQARAGTADWVARLWSEKPARYSRAMLETLALIAYRQPVTRGEIEDIRGVTVSSNIIRSLLERGWVTVLGHKEVPGRPALYGTTRLFLDYFNLKTLEDLPSLAELQNLEKVTHKLDFDRVEAAFSAAEIQAAKTHVSELEAESEDMTSVSEVDAQRLEENARQQESDRE